MWDPIGVRRFPTARDEYSTYAGVVFNMLRQGAAKAEIAKYLHDIRVEHISMGTRADHSAEDEIAELLKSWADLIFAK